MRWRLQQGKGVASWSIGWFGGGGYSHIDVFTPAGMLRGARSDVHKGIPAGYEDRPFDYDDGNLLYYTIVTLAVTPAQEAMYWEFSNAQLHKPYDKRGIAGFAFGKRNWRDPDSWYCSEEVQANCEYATIFRRVPDDLWRIDPGDNAFEFVQCGASFLTTDLRIAHA
jgi:hypothetical protein